MKIKEKISVRVYKDHLDALTGNKNSKSKRETVSQLIQRLLKQEFDKQQKQNEN